MRDEVDALLFVDGLELDCVVCVLSPACRTSAVEVFFDMMPTETTDLSGDSLLAITQRLEKEELNLITTRAGPEVQVRYIHLLEAERAFLVFLVSIKREKSADVWGRVISEHDGQTRTASSSLQYASCTPARTRDLDWIDVAPDWKTGAGRDG
jgi:hypothetical protein